MSRISRRTVLRGVGVTMALPVARITAGLGQPGRGGRNGGTVSQALWRPVHGQRHQRESLVGQRVWRRDETEQVAGAAGAPEEEDHGHQRPLQQAGGRDGHPPRTDRQPAVGRADSEGTDRPVGDHDGPGPRQPRWPGHAAVQHRAGVRTADDRVLTRRTSRWRTARTFRGRARIRRSPNEVYPSLAFDNLFENRGSLRNQSILDRVRERAASLCHEVSASDNARLDEYLTSVREVEKRIERMRAAPPASRWTARRTGCRKTSGSTRG